MNRSLAVVALLSSAPALAHIALTNPPNRYGSNGVDGLNKHCPCGSGAGTQTCTTGPTTDPNRSTTVTTFAAGQQITITVVEAVGHSGRIRVAFDENGADLAAFNAHILADISDPSGSTGQICTIGAVPTDASCTGSNDNTWAITLTLPNTPCTNCTLQVIQDMNGVTETPVADPTGDPTYFQCADLILTGGGEGEGAAGEGEGEGEGERAPASSSPPGCSSSSTSGVGWPGAVAVVVLAAVGCRKRASSAR